MGHQRDADQVGVLYDRKHLLDDIGTVAFFRHLGVCTLTVASKIRHANHLGFVTRLSQHGGEGPKPVVRDVGVGADQTDLHTHLFSAMLPSLPTSVDANDGRVKHLVAIPRYQEASFSRISAILSSSTTSSRVYSRAAL